MSNQLLILSRDYEWYARYIEQANLADCVIAHAGKSASEVPTHLAFEIAFGEPNLLAEILPRLSSVQWVQSTWAGVEPLLADGQRTDYLLTNARGVFGKLMVEYVFGYLLAHERRILARWQSQNAQQWDARPPGTLQGKRLGLLGVGSIGSELAKAGVFFGMEVWGYTRASEDCPAVSRYFHGAQFPQFLGSLDYLVCVLPNTQHTVGLLNSQTLPLLPPHAVLLNVGRGKSIDEPALAEHLTAGGLGGAVLDVFVQEPLPPTHPFWHTPNLFVTSHTAALSDPLALSQLFCTQYELWHQKKSLSYLVDFRLGY
jgi:phosphoglycerate dehydrogenase-like enzyme